MEITPIRIPVLLRIEPTTCVPLFVPTAGSVKTQHFHAFNFALQAPMPTITLAGASFSVLEHKDSILIIQLHAAFLNVRSPLMEINKIGPASPAVRLQYSGTNWILAISALRCALRLTSLM
jgi:hypothetical protein